MTPRVSPQLTPLGRRARVLITDAESRTALACVRALVAAGHECWVAGPHARTLAGVSRGARTARVAPSPGSEPLAYAQAIAEAARTLAIDVLLPVSDAAMEALLAHRALLPPSLRLPVPPLETFRAGTDKRAMLARAARAGFQVPSSREAPTREEALLLASSVPFPAILKPHRSVVPGRREKVDVEFVDDADALRAALLALPDAAFPVVIQERVPGPGEGLFALRWQGRLVATFAHRRLREKPPAGGISVLRESIAPSAELVAAASALLDDLDWEGVAMIECKRDLRTGRHAFIEVNGRLWGSLQLAIDAGVDFPTLLVERAMGWPSTVTPPARIGVRSRWFWGDIDHLYARCAHSARALHLEGPARSRAQVLWDIVVDGIRARAEIERLSDPMPALLEWSRRLAEYAAGAVRAVRRLVHLPPRTERSVRPVGGDGLQVR